MTVPPLPTGFDVAKRVRGGPSNCQLTVGFDDPGARGHIPRFLVRLHYYTAGEPDSGAWTVIARMDHNETAATGHDIYQEGLHVDMARRGGNSVHVALPHGPLSQSRGMVLRQSAGYLQREAEHFIDVYERRCPPGAPPGWPDGGQRTHTFMSPSAVDAVMAQESPDENAISLTELSEEIAKVTDATAEEIEAGAADINIGPPHEGEIVEYGEHDGEHGFLPDAGNE